jgi:glycosyltransferase involved in cell wall biosynthesis
MNTDKTEGLIWNSGNHEARGTPPIPDFHIEMYFFTRSHGGTERGFLPSVSQCVRNDIQSTSDLNPMPTPVQPDLLIFEPQSGAHRGDFVRALAAGLAGRRPAPRVRFALAHDFFRTEPALAERMAAMPGISVSLLPEGAGPRDWPDLLKNRIKEDQPGAVLLFELTPFERWLGRESLGVPLGGILFVQYPELDWSKGPLVRRMERWLRFHIKERRTARWLRRQDWRSVFLLNGEQACDYLNHRFTRTPVFRRLPDPAPDPMVSERSPLSSDGSVTPVRFVFPGVLSRRKGAMVLFDALARLSPDVAGLAQFVCAGVAESADRSALERRFRQLRRKRPDITIEWLDRFLPEAELQAQIARAHMVLAPYQRTEYSSGILARAAAAGVPLLGPSDGLLGRLILENGLGATAETTPCAWAAAIESAVRCPPTTDERKRTGFVRRSSSSEFARVILEGLNIQ